MKTVIVTKYQVEDSIIGKTVLNRDVDRIINEDCQIYCDGKLIATYFQYKEPTDDLLEALQSLDYSMQTRQSEINSYSATIGYQPRGAAREQICNASKNNWTNAKATETLFRFASKLSGLYRIHDRATFIRHQLFVNKHKAMRIHPDYLISDTPFTSGISNYNWTMGYHIDDANIANVNSAMIVLKNGMSGGRLIFPEYRIGFECPSGTVVLFNGKEIIHGVTPIKHKTKYREGYRYSLVFYTRRGMCRCLPTALERAEANRRSLKINKKGRQNESVQY